MGRGSSAVKIMEMREIREKVNHRGVAGVRAAMGLRILGEQQGWG